MFAFAKPATRRLIALIVVLAGMGGCATYRPLPLTTKPTLAWRIDQLQGGSDARLPLDEATVLRLVMLNNPTLAASRAQRGVEQAQVLDASVLPNPSVQASLGFLVSGEGHASAWSAGFAQSLQALVTHGVRRDEARSSASSTDAKLLWEAWVTLSRARTLVIDVVDGERRLAVQERIALALESRAASLHAAVARGDEEAGTASAVFAAASDARSTHDDARRTLLAQRAELASLMNLDPSATLPLAALPASPRFDAERAQASIASMGEHRPDLAALRFGYAAQEARVRGAILSQFAPLSIGMDASRDSSRVLNIGPAVSFDLPLFDRQQGKIAVAEATRQQLHDEYTARIDSATAEAHALVTAVLINEHEATRVPVDTQVVDAAGRALGRGDIDARTYSDLSVATLGQVANDITRDIYRREQRIAFDALTGAGLPNSLPPRIAP